MFNYLGSFCYQHKKIVSFVATFLILLMFGDAILHFIGHVLHVLLEVVESILEHFLEEVFDLTPRQAQIVLFYSFFVLASYASWRIGKKIYFTSLEMCAVFRVNWHLIKKHPWFRATLMLVGIGTTVYIFS